MTDSATPDDGDDPVLTLPLAGERPIPCPSCGSDVALHFDEVSFIDPRHGIVPVHADGHEDLSVVSATLAAGDRPDRLHRIVLPHWCGECGARGELVLRHSGGQTLLSLRATPNQTT